MFITSLLIVSGLCLTCAQVGPLPCRPPTPPPGEITRFDHNATNPSRSGRTPRANIRKKDSCYRYIREGQEASKIDPADWITKPSNWISVCEGRPRKITLNTWIFVKGTICYVPPIFRKFTYPTLDCPFQRCRGVNAVAGEVAWCRPDNRKIYKICAWCFRNGKFVKEECEIKTYRCCSCCRYRCPR